MKERWKVLLPGMPVTSSRGALGWCSVSLIRDTGRHILVDTGSYGDRALLLKKLQDEQLGPGDIDDIFLTHFHYDHVLNCDLFPGAVIHLSETECQYVVSGGHEQASDPFVPAAFYSSLQRRVRLFSGDTELFPGMRTVSLPGHTPGMAGLLLEKEGVLFAGDGVKNAREFCKAEAPPVFYSLDAARQSYEKAGKLARIIVPGHDNPFRLPFRGAEDYLTCNCEEMIWSGPPGTAKEHIRLPGGCQPLKTD